jgi:hypothetical protein
MILKIQFLSHKKTNHVSITKINLFMFFKTVACLFPETYETHKYTVWSKSKMYVNGDADGTVHTQGHYFILTRRVTADRAALADIPFSESQSTRLR